MDLITFKFSAHRPSGETMRRITQRFRSAITCSRSRSIVPNLLGLGLRTAPKKDKKCGVFLPVCLSVKLLDCKVCAKDFARKAL